MPYALSDDEQAMQKVVREFAQARVTLASAHEADRHDRVPDAHVAEAAQLGLASLADPAAGLGATAYALAIDEVAQVDANLAAILSAHNACLAAAVAAKHDVAARLAAGEMGAWLIAEEATGSDIQHPGTTAMPILDAPDAAAGAAGSGRGFRLTGQKVWGIHAAGAKHFLVLAHVPDSQGGAGGGPSGPTLFHLPADAPGVSLGANEPLLGLRAAGIRTVYLYGVKVPSSAVVGGIGNGLAIAALGRHWLQVGAAAALCGCVGGALEAAARFAETRRQFNAPIGTYQAVSEGLATMDTELAAGRALVLAAAARIGSAAAGAKEATDAAERTDAGVWAARAKAFCAEMAVPMTRQAIRIQGGTGFMREGGTERFARDVRALQFVGESTQMHRDTLRRAVMPGIEFPAAP